MSLRFCVVVIGLFFLFFIASAGGNMAWAQQIMTPVSGSSGTIAGGQHLKAFVDNLQLVEYEAAAGDLSLCAGDEGCLRHAKKIKSWLCAAALCDGTDNRKAPGTCFPKISQGLSIGKQLQINETICPVIKSPNTKTRRALLSFIPKGNRSEKEKEDDLVKEGACLMALRMSAGACEGYIKNYVGAYGSQWRYEWFRALSGCRILAHESTRRQEEKDFYTWFGVAQGSGKCSNIVNSEMRNECYVPGATASIAAYVH